MNIHLWKFTTLEEGCVMGGFGSAIAEALMDADIIVPVKRFGVPDVGNPRVLHDEVRNMGEIII